MNNQISSKEQLIGYCKEIVRADGLQAISIRSVAKKPACLLARCIIIFHQKGNYWQKRLVVFGQRFFIFLKRPFILMILQNV